eukprot:4096866-Amphidinium_carterae.1
MPSDSRAESTVGVHMCHTCDGKRGTFLLLVLRTKVRCILRLPLRKKLRHTRYGCRFPAVAGAAWLIDKTVHTLRTNVGWTDVDQFLFADVRDLEQQ